MKAKFKLWKIKLQNILKKEAWIITGKEKHGNQTLKILFAGRKQNKYHIVKLAFGEQYEENSLGIQSLLKLRKLCFRNDHQCDLAVIEGVYFDRHVYHTMNDFFIPLWLESKVSIPFRNYSNSAKEDLRKIRKNELNYYVTNDKQKLQIFYHEWYIPMIRNQHKKEAFEYTFETMMKKVEDDNCELLVITKDGNDIAGVLIQSNVKVPVQMINGIADFKFLKYGAISSTYFFSAEYLGKFGFKNMSFANSRSFLNDGLLQYKKKWRPTVTSSDTRGYILKPLKNTPSLESFMVNNPFVYLEKNKLYGALFIAGDKKQTELNEKSYKKDYSINGLLALNIFKLDRSFKTKRITYKMMHKIDQSNTTFN